MMLELKTDPLAAVFDAAETATAAVETPLQRPALEAKAATINPPAKGGLGVPLEIDAVINRVLLAASPIRSIAQVVDIGSSAYRRLITTSGVVSGWVSETQARPETETPNFSEIAPPMGELYANPAASRAIKLMRFSV